MVTDESVIRFTTAALPISKLGDGKQHYHGVIQAFGTKSILQTAKDMEKLGLTVDHATAAHVMNFFAEHLPELMAADGGCRRNLGDLVTFYPIMDGQFDSPDGKFDASKNAIRIAAIPPKDLRMSLTNVKLLNITEAVAADIYGWMDLGTRVSNGALRIGDTITITGSNLWIIPAQKGEGVWLVPTAGDPVALTDVISGDVAITATIPATTAAGMYTLRVCTRAGRTEEMALQTLEKKEIMVAAEAVDAKITYVYDQATNTADTLIGKGALEIDGENLALTDANADEGVWLTRADGTEVMKLTVSTSNAAKIIAAAAEPPAAGAYTLKVVTRGGKPATAIPATLTRAITAQ